MSGDVDVATEAKSDTNTNGIQTTVVTQDVNVSAAGDVAKIIENVTVHIHVKNLTRPFTMPQLKELLNKYGRTLDDKFWIDNVKSHCYVTVIEPFFLF